MSSTEELGASHSWLAQLRVSLRAGSRAALIVTEEEQRAVALLEELGEELEWDVHIWNAASGTDHRGPIVLEDLLRDVSERREESLWVLLSPPPFRGQAANQRLVRELAMRSSGPAIVIVSPQQDPDLAAAVPELLMHSLSIPDARALAEQLIWIGRQLERGGHVGAAEAFADHADALARTSLGLTSHVLDRVVAEAVLEVGVDIEEIESAIVRCKPRVLDRRGFLESVQPVPMTELGGLTGYKSWLNLRRHALAPDARAAGIPAPRGALLLGVQGCGKSLAARATANELGLALVRLDPGRLFGGTVGESEANLRYILATVGRMAPVVLWLDEVDKSLAGSEGSASDAGTTARVVGGLLTWLQEREEPVFVVATANDVGRLPPEFLRRGRLDEVFFVDLPNAEEREAILRVHLCERPERELGEMPALADAWELYAKVARDAETYSGAELEAAVAEARLQAYAQDRDLAATDLRAAIDATIPLSTSHAEHINALRGWAKTRARSAGASSN